MSSSNREKLLEAGLKLLSEKTFSEISMDQVAETSGVSKPMIYYYFDSKEGYYKGLAEHLLQMARNMTPGIFRKDDSLRENLRRYVEMRMRFSKESPCLSKAYLAIITDPNIGLLIDELQNEFDVMRLEFIDPMFDAAEISGEIKKGTNRLLVMMMLNSLLVSYTLKIVHNIDIHNEIEPDEILDILFDGIARCERTSEE